MSEYIGKHSVGKPMKQVEPLKRSEYIEKFAQHMLKDWDDDDFHLAVLSARKEELDGMTDEGLREEARFERFKEELELEPISLVRQIPKNLKELVLILHAMHLLLDGNKWDSDTTWELATLVKQATGIAQRNPDNDGSQGPWTAAEAMAKANEEALQTSPYTWARRDD
jgi:hypothetical protein